MAGELAKQLTEKADEKRSALYLWIRRNYAEIDRAMARRKSWKILADTATEAALLDREGKPIHPTPAAVRSAWLRVTADRTRTTDRKTPKPQTAPNARAPVESTPRPVPTRQPEALPDQDDEPAPIREPRHKFGGVPVTNRLKPKE